MHTQGEHLVTVRVARNRKWKALGLFVAITCLISLGISTFILFRCPDRKSETPQSTNAQTTNLAEYTATSLDSITTMVVITNSTQSTLSSTETSINLSSTSTVPPSCAIIIDENESCPTFSLPEPVEYAPVGRPLANFLYLNVDQLCLYNGYVKSVDYRLFTAWKGNAPLYLYIIPTGMMTLELKHRYTIQPKRNTTAWQTAEIPPRVLPIYLSSFLAIGMQESGTNNTVFGVKATGISTGNITETSLTALLRPELDKGVALRYTIVRNVVTTTKKPT